MKDSKSTKLKKRIEQKNTKHSAFFAVLVAIAAICISPLFMLYSAKYDPISREEAATFSGEFESYKESNYSKYDSVLYFKDGHYFYVSLACESKEFIKSMKSLEKGTVLDILVNPNNDCIIEIKKDSDELLNFETAQKAIDSENNGYFIIGIICCVSGIGLIAITLLEHSHKKASRPSRRCA